MKYVFLTLLVIGFPCLIFGSGHRDELYIENRTDDDIVIVTNTIGLRDGRLFHNIDNERTVSFRFMGGLDDPKAFFRTIKPRETKYIGYSQYSYEEFKNFSPTQKFSAFFDLILIFSPNGDLLYRIDNFDNAVIEDRTSAFPGEYVLVIK